MDYLKENQTYLNEDQMLMIEAVREFNEKEVAPRVLDELEQDKFPSELLDRMKELGLVGITLPEEYGGIGERMVTQAAVEKELAKESMTMAMVGTTTITSNAVLRHGTDEQKEKLLPLMRDKQVGFALTEPVAGSDVSSIETTAVKDGDEWVINGQKTFISFAGHCDYLIVGCKTHETGDGGISTFLVPEDIPGFSTGTPFKKLGFRGSGTAEVFLDDVHIPAGNLIGKENKGMHVALSLLDEARVGVAAIAVGLCEASIEKASTYIKERIAFGRPLATQEGLQWYLAEMDARTSAARALMYQAARNFDEGKPVTLDAARAKFVATQAAMFCTNKAVQMCGGLGLMVDFGVERMYRDAKVLTIIEGTDEILKMVISRSVLH